MFVSKYPCRPNAHPRARNASPNVTIGFVGYARVGFALGMLIHVVCFFYLALGIECQHDFWWNMGLNYHENNPVVLCMLCIELCMANLNIVSSGLKFVFIIQLFYHGFMKYDSIFNMNIVKGPKRQHSDQMGPNSQN